VSKTRSYPIGATTSILSPAGRGLVAAIEAQEIAAASAIEPDPATIDALAETLAAISGKSEIYEREQADPNADPLAEGYQGIFMGYQIEAEEMIRRLRVRGFDIVPVDRRD
jgi:P2-related tail formation protein